MLDVFRPEGRILKMCYHIRYTLNMGKVRRGNYIFLAWKGDHSPRHVHVYRDSRLVAKWNLEDREPMSGRMNKRLLKIIEELEKEGLL